MLAPHLTARNLYMATPPEGHPRPARDAPRQHVAGGPAEDARQGLPAPRPRLPAGDPGPPLTGVGRPLAPPSQPLDTALPPPTHQPPLRGMRHGVVRSADRRQQGRAVLPGGRVPLARTSRGAAQAHRGGGFAAAHRGGTRPLTRTRGPRGRRPPVDPLAPAKPHVCRAPVTRVLALTPTRSHTLQGPQQNASAKGGTGRGTPGRAAKRNRWPSGAS